jgi:membrane protease YdiL (CAAX protease family)
VSTITTPSQPAVSSSLRRLIAGHPLLAFFTLAFAGEWIVMLPLILAQNGMGVLPYTLPAVGPYPLSYYFAAVAALFGPTLASFTVTAVTTGPAGVRQLLRRYVLWRVGLRWYLLVLVGLPLFQLALSCVFVGIAPLTAFVQHWQLYFTIFLPQLLVISLAVQIWEEGGWSGFALPALQERFGAWRACLVLGPLWALFHLAVFFVPGQIFDSRPDAISVVVEMVVLMIGATVLRIGMTWVFNNTMGSILIAVLLHAALDSSNAPSVYITHLLSKSQLGGYGLVTLLLPLVAAVVLLIVTRGRLSYKPVPNLQPVPAV